MIRRPPRSTLSSSSAASDVYKRQVYDWKIWFRLFFVPTDDLPNNDCRMIYGELARPECVTSIENWHFVIFGAWTHGYTCTMVTLTLWSQSPALLNSLRRSLIAFSLFYTFLLTDLAYPMIAEQSSGMHALAPQVRRTNLLVLLAFQYCFTVAVAATRYTRRPVVTCTVPLRSKAAQNFRAVCFLDALSITIVVVCAQFAVEFLIDLTHDIPITRAAYFFQRTNQCHQFTIVVAALASAFSSDPQVWRVYSGSWFVGFTLCLAVTAYSWYIMRDKYRPLHLIAEFGVPAYIAFHSAFLPPTDQAEAGEYAPVCGTELQNLGSKEAVAQPEGDVGG
eukprot:TRINITY_DN18908_c0_g1_i2.p1 TRINITY_DN18908_c0_g1~~TRINITY_DN18908_c0_g1_i2.p1  ORF type:complete len:335 (-),score=52.31 TRINITY_DN18908_c0_g1_i2:178-1182(-)